MFKNNLIQKYYVIKPKCATTTNPPEKSILERIQQVIANLVCKFNQQNICLDTDYPWTGILAATDLRAHVLYHTKLQDMPVQMVFVRYML